MIWKSPNPIFLAAGSGSYAEQTAEVMMAFEKVCMGEKPDIVIVVGDVNSTLACSVVEAGLRSFDFTMPEEINRIVTDSISDYFFVTKRAPLIILREGKPKERIH